MAKAKKKRTGARRKLRAPARVELRVDRALKRRWDRALGELQEARREGASAFDRIWETVGVIIEHEPPLFLAGGIATVREFLREYVREDERTAKRLVRVAKYASPRQEERYGTTKLDAILDYFEAKAGAAIAGRLPVAFDEVRVTVERDGERVRLGLDDLSVVEIRDAMRLLRRERGPRVKRSPVVRPIERALKGRELGAIRVSVMGGRVTLAGIPLGAWSAFVAAVSGIELPAAEAGSG